MDKKSAAGKVISDLPTTISIGESLEFAFPPIVLDFIGKINWVDNWEYFNGALLTTNIIDHNNHRVCGSAVMIAPGIAITATHVIEPWIDAISSAKFCVSLAGISPHGLELWDVKKMTLVSGTDISIASLQYRSNLPPDNRFHLTPITTRLPAIGEILTICGFRAGSEEYGVIGGIQSSVEANLWICQGQVKERYPQGRDKFMMPWPVLEVDCPTQGGMSGGAVYDKYGLLVGILCSSMEHENNEGTSYISLIWPALASSVEPLWPPGLIKGPVPLLELDKFISIDRPNAIRITYNEDSSEKSVYYSSWESE